MYAFATYICDVYCFFALQFLRSESIEKIVYDFT